MKIQYKNELVIVMQLYDPTACVYSFITEKNYSNDTNIPQIFVIHGLGLCIKLDIYVAHMFYE